MKHTFIPFLVLWLFTYACKRDDSHPHPHKPGCRLETLLEQKADTSFPYPPYPKPYKYTRTFGPDGKVTFLEMFILLGKPNGESLTGTVSHTANSVIMRDVTGDTLLIAELNRHGQPVKLLMSDQAPWAPHFLFRYYYDNRNRLVSSTYGYADPGAPVLATTKYEYGRFDNLTRISRTYPGSDQRPYTAFTYDYSRPIKGGDYEVGGMEPSLPWEVLTMRLLGYLEGTWPRHIVTQMTTTFYPEGTWTYEDQVINAAGYLESYRINMGGDYNTCRLIWNCGKGGGTKY
jgi:hypothetical protein